MKKGMAMEMSLPVEMASPYEMAAPSEMAMKRAPPMKTHMGKGNVGVPLETESIIWRRRSDDRLMRDWVPEPEEISLYLYSGRMKHVPPQKNKVVKIFLSSTFTDMYVERNYLMSNIFPKLQQYCRLSYDLEFQVVDMRWGVRNEASNDHSGPRLCMDELRSCQELSLGPNFVCLLGQRYGNRPLQAEIEESEFNIIIEALKSLSEKQDNIAHLKHWYRCDRNGESPMMVLTPLDEYNGGISSDEFRDHAEKIHKSLRLGSDQAVKDLKLTAVAARKYHWSVTEEEIYRGILSLPNAKDHALCFQRILTGINMKHSKVHRFVELTPEGEVNQETSSLMATLIEETKTHLGEENCWVDDNVKWSEEGGTNEKSCADYLDRFGKAFFEKVKLLIDRAATLPDPYKINGQTSGLLTEIAEHDHQAMAKIKTFQGRDDILTKIRKYIHSDAAYPYTMYGESGFGKTSLLAVASHRVYDWVGDTTDLIVVRRFLGTTPDSTNVGSLLHSVTNQISRYCRYKIPHTDDIMMQLVFCLVTLPDKYRLVIFLDSLDQLSAYGRAHSLLWLPFMLPKNVKLIVSTLPKDHGLLDIIKDRRYPSQAFVEVNILQNELALDLMNEWLKSANRRLTEEQMSYVAERFKKDENTSALYIKLIFDAVKQIRSYCDFEDFKSFLSEINSPVKCIRYIYNALMKQHGALLVHRLFAYLHLSNGGLTENELVDLISLDDEVLTDVFQYSAPPLRRLPAVMYARIRNAVQEYIVTREANSGKVIAWYHRQFVEVGDTMFKEENPLGHETELSFEQRNDKLRENMVEYFTGMWSNGTKKPFKYNEYLQKKLGLDSPESEEDRFVPAMPNMQDNGRPNLRKLGQLPNLLIKLNRIDQFFSEVFGNVEGLVGLFTMNTWSEIYQMVDSVSFDNYKAIGKDKDEQVDKSAIEQPFQILTRTFLLSSAIVCQYPKMLGPLVLGRLLPFSPGSALLHNFAANCYEKGPKLNSFVTPHGQLEGVGTRLIFEMPNDHLGACTALIEITPGGNHFILSVSKKAVLINMEDGNIQMRYTPPDLGRDDSFKLLAAHNPMSSPTEVVASLSIKPKIYIFNLKQYELQAVIDCRKVSGCEEMRIDALSVLKMGEAEKTVIVVNGNSQDGLLIFDCVTQKLLHRFYNGKAFLSSFLIAGSNKLFAIIQPKKMTVLKIKPISEKSKLLLQIRSRNTAKILPDVEYVKVGEMALSLPGDSIITAKTLHTPDEHGSSSLFFATEDGHLYAGHFECASESGKKIIIAPPAWGRILLDSPAHKIVAKNGFVGAITACTKNFVYVLHCEVDKESQGFEFVKIGLIAKIKDRLSYAAVIDHTMVGYHLGQLALFSVREGQHTEKNQQVEVKLIRKFDAHAKPITDIVINEDIAAMVLTAAEDGSVRVFHIALPIHPLLQNANTFDRMGVPIHHLSAAKKIAASQSTESNTVLIWNVRSGKITHQLEHEVADGITIIDVMCFDDHVVSVSSDDIISFWNINNTKEPVEQQTVSKYRKMDKERDSTTDVLVICDQSWHIFNVNTGQVNTEKVYDDRQIVKHVFAEGQLTLLQLLLDDDALVIEIYKDGKSEFIEVAVDKNLSAVGSQIQDIFCYGSILVLIYLHDSIFYNWVKREVLESMKITKAKLLQSKASSFVLRSNLKIQSLEIKHGVEKLSSRKLNAKVDRVRLTPDGHHCIVVEEPRMLLMFRIGDLSNSIGMYSMYGDIERISFTSDSSAILMSVADTRVFILMLCDVKMDGHLQRIQELKKEHYTPKEVRDGKTMTAAAGKEQDSDSEDEEEASKMSEQINVLGFKNEVERSFAMAEKMNIYKRLRQGQPSLRAVVGTGFSLHE